MQQPRSSAAIVHLKLRLSVSGRECEFADEEAGIRLLDASTAGNSSRY
jgi:hypothetical protein